MNKPQKSLSHYFVLLVGIYFMEGVSLVLGMGIPVFSVGLAFILGVVLGLWLRSRTTARDCLKQSFFITLYACLPAVSFIFVPIMAGINGRNIVSAVEGIGFGIPEFLPFPFNTILGFYAVCIIGAFILKMVITIGEVSFIILLGNESNSK